MLWISQNLHNTQKIDTETPLLVRCKHFARLWPTVDLCSSKMMIAEVLHQHVLYCDFHFQITAGAF